MFLPHFGLFMYEGICVSHQHKENRKKKIFLIWSIICALFGFLDMARKQKYSHKFGLGGGMHKTQRKALGYGRKARRFTCHYPVCFTRHTSQLQTKKRNHNSIKYRSFTIFEKAAFSEDLYIEIEKIISIQSDLNMNFSTWNALFLSILNKHAPIKEKRIKRAKKSAWLTEEITAAQKNRDFYHKKQDWENFKLRRNKTKSLIRTAKKAFFENAINENRDNSFLWQHVKDITGQSKSK